MKITCGIGVLLLCCAFATISAASVTTFSQQYCQTKSATTSTTALPTTTTTKSVSVSLTVTVTTTPTRSVTPSARTSTVTSTSTITSTVTQSANTATFTTTSTFSTYTYVNGHTTTTTATTTETQSVTVEPSTTVSTSPGFTPFASNTAVIAAGGASKKLRRASRRENTQLEVKRDTATASGCKLTKSGSQCPQPRYPSSVTCYKIIEIVSIATSTATAKTTKTITLPLSTVSITSTTTRTATTTAPPSQASTTTTSTVTSTNTISITQTSTTTTTMTKTATVIASKPTSINYYPECASNNRVSYVGGVPLSEVDILDAGTTTVSTDAQDDVSCCIQCVDTLNCSGFAKFGNCLLIISDTCDATAMPEEVFTRQGVSPFVFGNGNCGQGIYAGSR